MSDISTRVWLPEPLWDVVRARALADGTTVRELIPRLLDQAVTGRPTSGSDAAPVAVAATPATTAPAASEPPTVPLSDSYQCGVCGAQVRAGGLSNHLGKHLKEQQAAEAERSGA